MTGERDSVGRLTHGSHCKLCFSSLYDLPCVFVCLCSEVKKTFTFEQLRDEASSKIGNQETWNHGQLSEISLTTSLQNAAPGGTSRRLFVSKRCRKRRPCTIAAARILLPTMGCFIGVSRGLTSLEKSMMWHMDQRCVFDDASWVRRWIIRSKILWWFYLRNTADVECFGSFPTNSKVVIYMPMIPEAGHPHSFASLDAGRGFDHAPLVTHWFQHTNRILSYSIPDIFRHVLAEQLRERGISLQNYKLIALTATIDANCWKVITGSVCHVGLCTLGSSAFRGLWWLCRAAGLDMATKRFQNDAFSKAAASHRGLNWLHASKMLSQRRWFGPLAALNPKASSAAVGHKAFVVVG